MTVNCVLNGVSSCLHAPFRFMDCLNTNIFIFMLRYSFMNFPGECTCGCSAHKMFCPGRLFCNFFHWSFVEPKLCLSAGISFCFHTELSVRLLFRQSVHCLICFVSGIFCFFHSFFHFGISQIILCKAETGRSFCHTLRLLFFCNLI